MRTTTRQTGVISYAGLDEAALWAGAKRAFAQADGWVPPRFRSFLPIFPVELIVNMSYVGNAPGNRARVSPEGFSTDETEYHQKLCAELPELYTGDNARRCFAPDGRFRGGVVTVDRAWATMFPQYQPFMGERLAVHLIGGGHQAAAVPESIFPRGGGVLAGVERDLRITARCAHVTAYIKARIAMGERYDPARFEEDYLRVNELNSVCVRQKQLGRVMQELSILGSLEGGRTQGPALFTLNAKRAEGVRQYAPWRYACDTFERAPVTRATARLAQLCFEGDPFMSDLWLPYQDFSEYIDRQSLTVNVYALCHGFQIAPAYDARTGGGRYPARARVAVVRDRELHPLVAEAINNPAYGSGMGPLGLINKLVYLPGSRELLRQNRLALEETSLQCEHTTVDAAEYGRMRALAALQEWKGRLIDALYREESALAQMQPGTPAYARAEGMLARQADALEAQTARAAARCESGQLSGYDADLAYLRRMRQHRMGLGEDGGEEPAPFATDALREMCIESGFAMRACVREYPLDGLLMPEEEPAAPMARQGGATGAFTGGTETVAPSDGEAAPAGAAGETGRMEAPPQASAPTRQSGAPTGPETAAFMDSLPAATETAPAPDGPPPTGPETGAFTDSPPAATETAAFTDGLPTATETAASTDSPPAATEAASAPDGPPPDGAQPAPAGAAAQACLPQEGARSAAGQPAPRAKAQKIAGAHKMPRFEQIDMFAAVGAPPAPKAAEAGPTPPGAGEAAPQAAAAPDAAPEPPRPAYVLRTLKQLAGEKRAAAPGKMARLVKEPHK
ncbi:MAG: hypothetical protein MR842_05615 [Clostridiales bacterium]|nr:hypothetical protein [Clostridiales bacterium]MDY4008852.1 hypothetical protein [Candidatus Limiplasma sp.]